MLILPTLLKHAPKHATKLAPTSNPGASSTRTMYFRPTSTSLSSLRSNDGRPAFKHFKPHPPTRFEDVYYDTLPHHGALARQGLHLRRRTGLWQLVIKSGSTSKQEPNINNQLQHKAPTLVQGREDVENALAEKLGWNSIRLGIFGAFDGDGSDRSKGLKEVGRWFCGVEKWDVDQGCKVVVNETEFGYRTGMVSCGGGADGDEDGVDSEGDGAERRLDKVAREYGWAFPGIGVGIEGEGALQGLDDGKLEAYVDDAQ